jgi:hypothetical protein
MPKREDIQEVRAAPKKKVLLSHISPNTERDTSYIFLKGENPSAD